jgi:hypothetical protein
MTSIKENPGAWDAGVEGQYRFADRNGPETNPNPATTQTALFVPTVLYATLSGCDEAYCCGITVKARAPVLELCRRLVAAGYPWATPLQAYRGSTLCLRVLSIGAGAGLDVADNRLGVPIFRRRRERSAGDGRASPMRPNAGAAA